MKSGKRKAESGKRKAESGKRKQGRFLDSGLWSLDAFFVNFEPFCGGENSVECPGARVEKGFAAKRHEKTRKMQADGNGWRVKYNWWRG